MKTLTSTYNYLSLFLAFFCAYTAQGQFDNNNIGGVKIPNAGSFGGSKKTGKIIDDSTKQVYGPSSVRFFTEADLLNNRQNFSIVDTSITNFHAFLFTEKSRYRWQDLGNLGTAIRATFEPAPTYIGAVSGFDSYSLYAQNPLEFKYIDTKSPFTNMYFSPGGNAQNILHFDFSRNVSKRWNIGFKMRRFTGIKAWGTSILEDNVTGNWLFSLHSSYVSKNNKYTALGYFNIFDHSVNDQGGLLYENGDTPATPFSKGIDTYRAILSQASSRDLRNHLHTYQQYVLANGFQVYHNLEYQTQDVFFTHININEGILNGLYRGKTSTKIDTLVLNYSFSSIENRIGIKGFYKGYNYRAYARRRDYSFSDFTRTQHLRRNENYVGLWLNYYFADSTKAFAELEYLIGSDYRLQAQWQRKHITLGFERFYTSPTLVQQQFVSKLYAWQNNFDNVLCDKIHASFDVKLAQWQLKPLAYLQRIGNYIYYDTTGIVRQTSQGIGIFQVGALVANSWKKWEFQQQLLLTTTSGIDVVRLPKIYWFARLTHDFKYAKILFIQAGIDINYRSNYFANAYLPATQQFFLNDQYSSYGAVSVDVFANLRINRVRLFFKMSNINSAKNYAAPFNPTMQRSFGFGFNWPLFD